MYKFNVKPKENLQEFKDNLLFNDLFEYVCSGGYGEDILDIPNGIKIGYIINHRIIINLDEDQDVDYIVDFSKSESLYEYFYFPHILCIIYNGEKKYFWINIYIESRDMKYRIGIQITRNLIIKIFTGEITSSQFPRFQSCLYKDFNEESDSVKVIDMCQFDYYKLKNK